MSSSFDDLLLLDRSFDTPIKMNGLLCSTIENCGGFFPHFFPETDNPISPIRDEHENV